MIVSAIFFIFNLKKQMERIYHAFLIQSCDSLPEIQSNYRERKIISRMLFKIASSSETHLMKSKEGNSFKDLKVYVQKAFKTLPENFSFVYIDEEGDEINLDNQHDFDSLKETGMGKVNVKVIQIKKQPKFETQQAKEQVQPMEFSFVPVTEPISPNFSQKASTQQLKMMKRVQNEDKTEMIDQFMLKRGSKKQIQQQELKKDKELQQAHSDDQLQIDFDQKKREQKRDKKYIYWLQRGEKHGYRYRKMEDKSEPKKEQVKEDPKNNFIHDDITCDHCGVSPIIGNRYKCNVCDNYDLCQACEQDFSHEHALLKIKYKDQEYEREIEERSAVMIVGCLLNKGIQAAKSGFNFIAKHFVRPEEVQEKKDQNKEQMPRRSIIKQKEVQINVKKSKIPQKKVEKKEEKKPQTEQDRMVESANYLNSILGIDFTRCYAFVKKYPKHNNQELIVQYFDNVKGI